MLIIECAEDLLNYYLKESCADAVSLNFRGDFESIFGTEDMPYLYFLNQLLALNIGILSNEKNILNQTLIFNHLQNYETLISYMNNQWWKPNSEWKFQRNYKSKVISLYQLYDLLCNESTQQEEKCKEYFIPKSVYSSNGKILY